MARRAALIALAVGLVSCGSNDGGSNNDWVCNWVCNSNDPPTHGSKTYPNGPNPGDQCTQEFGPGAGCNSISCTCTQN